MLIFGFSEEESLISRNKSILFLVLIGIREQRIEENEKSYFSILFFNLREESLIHCKNLIFGCGFMSISFDSRFFFLAFQFS